MFGLLSFFNVSKWGRGPSKDLLGPMTLSFFFSLHLELETNTCKGWLPKQAFPMNRPFHMDLDGEWQFGKPPFLSFGFQAV